MLYHNILKSSKAAIDLASIMVGVIVIGLIGGVIAAMVFIVIPWAQDNAAKQQLESAKTAQNAYAGLNAENGTQQNEDGTAGVLYGTYPALTSTGLLSKIDSLNISLGTQGTCYIATSKSDSGAIFWTDSKENVVKKFIIGDQSVCGNLSYLINFTSDPVMSTVYDMTLSTNCSTIQLPIQTGVKATIDWGDGVVEKVTTGNPKHTYTDISASREIKVAGTFGKYGGATVPSNVCLLEVSKWGETGTIDLAYAFYGASNLKSIISIPTGVTSTTAAFWAATGFNSDISNWNMSKVDKTNFMFYGASSFNQDIGDWDVSKVTDMSQMFTGSSFNKDLSDWDVSGAKNISYMFSGTTAFNQSLNEWDVSNVTNMSYMFYGAKAFNQPLNQWKTNNVASFANMFNGAIVFNSNITSFNFASATDTNRMFYGATVFNQDISGWKTGTVKNMDLMFYYAHAFKGNLSSWEVANVTTTTPSYLGPNFAPSIPVSSHPAFIKA